MDVKRAYDICAFIIQLLGVNWQPKHIVIGLFEAYDTFGHALTKHLIDLLDEYDLKKNYFYV
jgi:hypothetical protein